MRTGVPGRLGGWSRGAWAASPGSLGHLPGLPGRGGVPAECLRPVGGNAPLEFASKFMSILMSIFGRLGLILGPSWGSFLVMLAPFSTQVGPGTVFEPCCLRKSDCSRNITFSIGFCSQLTPRWGQDRPKIVLRQVQDRLGSMFFPLRFALRFLIVLGSILLPFWPPK